MWFGEIKHVLNITLMNVAWPLILSIACKFLKLFNQSICFLFFFLLSLLGEFICLDLRTYSRIYQHCFPFIIKRFVLSLSVIFKNSSWGLWLCFYLNSIKDNVVLSLRHPGNNYVVSLFPCCFVSLPKRYYTKIFQ